MMSKSNSRMSTPRPMTSKSVSYITDDNDKPTTYYYYYKAPDSPDQDEILELAEPIQNTRSPDVSTSADEVLGKKDSLRNDFENIFGPEAANIAFRKPMAQQSKAMLLPKKKIKMKKMKPRRDSGKYLEKMKTVVKMKDKSKSCNEISYGSDWEMDLITQELMNLPTVGPVHKRRPDTPRHREFSFDKIIATDKKQDGNYFNLRDENFNDIKWEREDSDISFENEGLRIVVLDEEEKDMFEARKIPTKQQLFSQTLISTMKNGQVKVKRNKVSPNTSNSSTMIEEQRGRGEEYMPPQRPCLPGLLKLIARISMTRAIRRGLRSRYERYQKSSSIFSFPTVTKRTQSNDDIEEIWT